MDVSFRPGVNYVGVSIGLGYPGDNLIHAVGQCADVIRTTERLNTLTVWYEASGGAQPSSSPFLTASVTNGTANTITAWTASGSTLRSQQF